MVLLVLVLVLLFSSCVEFVDCLQPESIFSVLIPVLRTSWGTVLMYVQRLQLSSLACLFLGRPHHSIEYLFHTKINRLCDQLAQPS